jgi:alpha-tubulin suppressor-like RCC1 family protein
MNRRIRSILIAPLALLFLLVGVSGAGAVTPQIVSNSENVCGLVDTGVLKCAGYNLEGQLGIGNNVNPSPGFKDVLISDVTQVAVGDLTMCAIKGDRSVWCWGANFD